MKTKNGKTYVYAVVGFTGIHYGMFTTLRKARRYIDGNSKFRVHRYEVH